jgi:Leucine-rich repeat (LRR) protein
MDDAYGEEIVGLMESPVVAGLRGLELTDIEDDNEADAVRAIAKSPHLTGLCRLYLDFHVEEDDLRRLAKAEHLASLEDFMLDYPSTPGIKHLGNASWFRNLRSLHLYMDSRDTLKAIAELPKMPNLVSLKLRGSVTPTVAALRKFVASNSFPKLAALEFPNSHLTTDQVALLARGSWPLRRLKLRHMPVRKAGAEALARAPFAETLRILELPECEITTGGVQALAASPALSGLRHLDLNSNPVGPNGLAAIARSEHLRGLRSLDLSDCNSKKAPLDTVVLFNFLSALDMPDLRHLKLERLPVGVRGARALATSNSFANLTRLSLPQCGLRENGARAIIESGTLNNLAVLNLSENSAGKGVSKLGDPKVMPRLACADLTGNRVPTGPVGRLRKRPGVRV